MASLLGSRGGLATVKKYGKKRMKKISKLAIKARWPKPDKAEGK